MLRRVLVLLTAVVMAAMLSVGPAFADGGDGNNCHWDDWHWARKRDDDDDDKHGGGGFGGFLYRVTTGPFR